MTSETALSAKDVVGPRGSISIESGIEEAGTDSSDVDAHTVTNAIHHHHAELDADGTLARADDVIVSTDEPSHEVVVVGVDFATVQDATEHRTHPSLEFVPARPVGLVALVPRIDHSRCADSRVHCAHYSLR